MAAIAAKPPAQSAVAAQSAGGGTWRQSPQSRPRKARWRNIAAIAAKPPAQSAGGARGSQIGGYGFGGGDGRPEPWWATWSPRIPLRGPKQRPLRNLPSQRRLASGNPHTYPSRSCSLAAVGVNRDAPGFCSFYDHIGWVTLVETAHRLHLTPSQIALAAQSHREPRLQKAGAMVARRAAGNHQQPRRRGRA